MEKLAKQERREGSAVRQYDHVVGDNRRSFDCAPARPATEAGRKFFAGASLRMTSSVMDIVLRRRVCRGRSSPMVGGDLVAS